MNRKKCYSTYKSHQCAKCFFPRYAEFHFIKLVIFKLIKVQQLANKLVRTIYVCYFNEK